MDLGEGKMASSFQDDEREEEMRRLFGLIKDVDEGRSGIDAHLDFNGKLIPFELKTTSNGSVTTVRDFGPDHIRKWKNKHWLIGFFIKGEEYYKYATPAMMTDWIEEKEQYITPDFKLASLVSDKLTIENMEEILGTQKTKYSYEDAYSIQKRQYKKEKYLDLMDVRVTKILKGKEVFDPKNSGYSPECMLEILKDRAKYLVERGSTLNNPHIPFSYFSEWEKITENHAEKLKEMVSEYYEEC